MKISIHSFTNLFSLEHIKSVPPIFEQKMIPSINGLRAISIIFVVISHLRLIDSSPESIQYLGENVFWGEFGVQIFFVISGFLITGLLLKERVRTGGIDLKGFFFRRIIRIFPVFYAYLLVVLIFNVTFNLGISPGSFAVAAFYIQNFGITGSWLTAHSWSLAIEEQFYLVWPFILTFFRKRYIYFILFLLIYQVFLKPFLYYHHELENYFLAPFITYAPPLMAGAMLAVMIFKKWDRFILGKRSQHLLILTFPLAWLSLLPIHLRIWGWYTIPFSYLISSVFLTLFLYYLITRVEKTLLYKTLNNPVINYIGILSYSIYIWQQFFLIPTGRYPNYNPIWATYPYNVFGIILTALVSYNFLEKPFLKLKKYYSRKTTYTYEQSHSS